MQLFEVLSNGKFNKDFSEKNCCQLTSTKAWALAVSTFREACHPRGLLRIQFTHDLRFLSASVCNIDKKGINEMNINSGEDFLALLNRRRRGHQCRSRRMVRASRPEQRDSSQKAWRPLACLEPMNFRFTFI